MTKGDKKLLLKDLGTRLPYRVIVDYGYNSFDVNGNCIKHGSKCILTCYLLDILSPRQNVKGEYIKPYLRPMSSMTDEEIREFTRFASISQHRFFIGDSYFWYNTYEEEDWLNAHHFDYRGLIDKGLAIEASNDMYKI